MGKFKRRKCLECPRHAPYPTNRFCSYRCESSHWQRTPEEEVEKMQGAAARLVKGGHSTVQSALDAMPPARQHEA